MKTGIAHLPLHTGKAPAWLFSRMKGLAREVMVVMLYDFGPVEVLKRLSDPFWFQAFGCVLGFDWHSSGLTTTVCGAIKEGIQGVGAKTLRALSLLSELLYGAKPSFRDPARFSFAHGGKDGYPYPVDREGYDASIAFLREMVNSSGIGETEKKKAFRRLSAFSAEGPGCRT